MIKKKLKNLSKEELIKELDEITGALSTLYSRPNKILKKDYLSQYKKYIQEIKDELNNR